MNPKGTPDDDPTNEVTPMKRDSQDDIPLDQVEAKDEIVRSRRVGNINIICGYCGISMAAVE
jgi:hypothetical protein